MIRQVVQGDYCVGCGACASIAHGPLNMGFKEGGYYLPDLLDTKPSVDADWVCPFSGTGPNEDDLGAQIFNKHPNIQHDGYLGYYLANYAAYVEQGDERSLGSSGGLGTWLLKTMLSTGLATHVIHVKSAEIGADTPMFEYAVSSTLEEIAAGAKSKYYPVEMSAVMDVVRRVPGTYVFVGVPCFIKAVRLLALQDPVIAERIKFTLGLVCGHLKTDRFAKYVGWQMGVHPSELVGFDFRVKMPTGNANRYSVSALGRSEGKQIIRTSLVKDLFGTSWGYSFFKLNACDYCDDVLAELADVTIGDAWLPAYVKDPAGTNILTIRNPEILAMVQTHRSNLKMEELSARLVYESQAGGFRQRREGLAFRLHCQQQSGAWYPPKRVLPKVEHISAIRKEIYRQRINITRQSWLAYEQAAQTNDLALVQARMQPLISSYDTLVNSEKPKIKRWLQKLKRRIKTVIQRS